MRRTVLILAISALACAGCQKKANLKEYSDNVTDVALMKPGAPAGALHRVAPAKLAPPPPAAEMADAAAAPAADASDETNASPEDTAVRVAAGPPQLAYSYTYFLTLPHAHVDELRKKHEAACTAAGYKVCQVVSTAFSDGPHDSAHGKLEIRAAPAWLQHFRDGVSAEAGALGGKVQSAEVTSEDLSRQIVDTDAQLRAKTTLRDRLQGLLATHPGKVGDLLAVERELARVQGEIDSAQSELADMRGRVAMSDVTLTYSANELLGDAVQSPLAASFHGFFGLVASSLAAMIDVIGALLPWALVAAGLIWLFRKRLKTLRWPFGRKPPPSA